VLASGGLVERVGATGGCLGEANVGSITSKRGGGLEERRMGGDPERSIQSSAEVSIVCDSWWTCGYSRLCNRHFMT
jgi:hypothetical protein